jgi:Ca2+-binding RTX toxin-like protein
MRFKGTDGNDSFAGTTAADMAYGYAGLDRLFGAAGADLLAGGDGNDILSGGGQIGNQFAQSGGADLEADRIFGGAGDDIVAGGWNDRLAGGDGTDILTLDLSGVHRRIRIDFGAMAEGGRVRLGTGFAEGFERLGTVILGDRDDVVALGGVAPGGLFGRAISGGDGSDLIDARGLVDDPRRDEGPGGIMVGGAYTIDGDAGADRIFGSRWDDELYGDAGRDTIVLGGGRDIVYAGSGDDLIVADVYADPRGLDFSVDIFGGPGTDTVQVDGNRADWFAVVDGRDADLYRGYDNDPNKEDHLDLSGVERIAFDDGTVSIRDLATPVSLDLVI